MNPNVTTHAADAGGSKAASAAPSSSSMMRVKLDDTKAGMKGLDKDKINKIIFEASKGSKFYQNEQRRERELAAKIQSTLDDLDRLSEAEILKAEKRAEVAFRRVEASRDFSRVIVHVDMDCFYAAVHMRDDPSLKKIPMAVGGMGMLSTSNYLARRFGVRAAMPGFIAKKLCPDLVIVPSDFPKYNAVASVVRGVIAEYDAEFESGGCDEAYLDLTEHLVKRRSIPGSKELRVSPEDEAMVGCCRCGLPGGVMEEEEKTTKEGGKENNVAAVATMGEPANNEEGETAAKRDEESTTEEKSSHAPSNGRPKVPLRLPIVDRGEEDDLFCPRCELILPGIFRFSDSIADAVEEMRLKIFLRTRLTASAGVAPNAPLAKICSDQNKPNGQFLLPFDRESVVAFVRDLPVRKWPFIGKVQEKMLHAMNVFLLKDVRDEGARLLLTATSEGSFEYYVQAALGVGRNRLCGAGESERKSISTETTFSTMTDHGEMLKLLEELCGELAGDVEKKGYYGRTITLKLKNDDFKVVTRASTLGYKTRDVGKLFKVTSNLLKVELKKCPRMKLRLMGVRLSQLEEGGETGVESQSALEKFLGRGAGGAIGGDKLSKNGEKNLPSSSIRYTCPICDVFESSSLDQLNHHVDSCLIEGGEQAAFDQKPLDLDVDVGRLVMEEMEEEEVREIQSDDDLFGSGSLERRDSCQDLFSATGEEEEEEEAEEEDDDDDDDKEREEALEDQISDSASLLPKSAQQMQPHRPPLPSPSISQLQSFVCPICGNQIEGDLAFFNRHIDHCIEPSPTTNSTTSVSTSKPLSTAIARDKDGKGKRKRRSSGMQSQFKVRRIDSFFAKSSKT